MPNYILGISAYYHDSAAALIKDGVIIAAAHEERFTRKKHDMSFPENAIKYVLDEACITVENLSIISFYDKPLIKFERLLETYHAFVPKGLVSFVASIPIWIKEKLFMRRMLDKEIQKLSSNSNKKSKIPLHFPEHHLSHAASAFYPSPFKDAAILTIDGVGEWATTTIGYGDDKNISILKELHFPHSIGLLYSAFTYYTGFRVNSGEYKLMGLAPYGNPHSEQTKRFKELIYSDLIDLREDGSILLNMDYFNFATGLKMCDDKKWGKLFGIPPRDSETDITQEHMNMAVAIQQVTEDIVLQLAKTAKKLTKSNHLVMAGGVALNSVANGKLLKSGLFEDLWIQPAAGDAGGALGAALASWHIGFDNPKIVPEEADTMMGAYLGPEFSDRQIQFTLSKFDANHTYYNNFEDLTKKVAALIDKGNVIGWFQGRMEYGPRALGNRSIIGDARSPEMQKKMNLKIKYREGFRPFAPSVLEEDIGEYFELDRPSPYMLLVVPINESRRIPRPDNYYDLKLLDRLYHLGSDVPAITHVDYSGRLQSVNKHTNPRYWQIINEFKKLTGYGIIVNTSFNVRGEPIVCTPEDAYRCFMRTEMDYLVLGNILLKKTEQPSWQDKDNWEEEFVLD